MGCPSSGPATFPSSMSSEVSTGIDLAGAVLDSTTGSVDGGICFITVAGASRPVATVGEVCSGSSVKDQRWIRERLRVELTSTGKRRSEAIAYFSLAYVLNEKSQVLAFEVLA